MTSEPFGTIKKETFLSYISKKEQARGMSVVFAVMVAIGFVVALLYPLPFTFSDSGSYVQSAVEGTFNVYRPMGYSKYLHILQSVSPSFATVFWVTYLLHSLSCLWLLYTAKYLLKMNSGWLFGCMCAVAIAMPRMWFASNFLMSDALFTILTTLYVTTLLWIAHHGNPWMSAANLLLLWLLCRVRFSGLFYFPVSIVAILWSKGGNAKTKWFTAALPLILTVAAYSYTQNEYEKHTGLRTVSAFGGWQLINNASVLFPEAKQLPPEKFGTEELKIMHRYMLTCPDSAFDTRSTFTTDYMWENTSPYKVFLALQRSNNRLSYAENWTWLGKLYGDYAKELIKNYPSRYFTRFVLPSLWSNFKFQRIYEESNEFTDSPMYRKYYNISATAHEKRHTLFAKLDTPRRILNAVYWICCFASLTAFCVLFARKRLSKECKSACGIALLFVILFMAAQSVSSPNTTWRYTMPIFLPSVILMFGTLREIILLRTTRRTTSERE